MTPTQGTVAPSFAPVRDAFAANFEKYGEVRAACAVFLHGRPVVDLWGGLADRHSGRAWAEDTLQLVFSVTKGVTATSFAYVMNQMNLGVTGDPRAAALLEAVYASLA